MRVAILGLGAMGSRMAAALLAGGHSVVVWNRTPTRAGTLVDRGARLAASPRKAVGDVDIALAMVRDDHASRRVWLDPEDGALAGLRTNAIGVESSTLSLEWVSELSVAFRAQGLEFLDAPVVGSRAQAETGKLIHLVGGSTYALVRAKPVLSAIGSVVHHVGTTGSGAALKLIVNALLGVQVTVMAELLSAAGKMGIEPARALEILSDMPPCSPAAKVAAQAMLAQNFAPAFPIELVEKDLQYLAKAVNGSTTPLSTAARNVFLQAIEAGYGTENMTAVARLYQG